MRNIYYSMIFSWTFVPLIIFAPAVHAEGGQAYEVGTDVLNVRATPDDGAEIIGKLKSGDRLIVFQEKHGWVQTYYDGKEAWVASQFLIKSQTDTKEVEMESRNKITITADSVRLRAGPGTDNTIITHTSTGDVYELLGTDGDWHNVLLDNGSSAWVASWLTNQNTVQHASFSSKSSADTKGSLEGYNIVLDPGHGGKDPGAIGINGVKEKDLTLATAKSVAEKLRNAGATVLLTRNEDKYISLEDRIRISHSYWTDAFISIHYNAFTLNTSNGISTHYYSDESDYILAQNIQAALDKHTGFKSRGVHHDPYYVLRENNNLSALVELGFVSNANDHSIILNENHPSNVGNAITEGLINYFHH